MITNQGLYFEHRTKIDYWGEVNTAIHIYRDGTVLLFSSNRDTPMTFPTVDDFIKARPVIAHEIILWCREHNVNLDSAIRKTGDDVVPIMKVCSFCKTKKPLTEFPPNGISFDGTHSDCCTCRIAYCQKNKAYCGASPAKPECADCVVRERNPAGMR